MSDMPDEIYAQGKYFESGFCKIIAHTNSFPNERNTKYIRADLTQPAGDVYNDGFERTIFERDQYESVADNLSEAIAEYFNEEIGEHSSGNCPWDNALDIISNADKRALSQHPDAGLLAALKDASAELNRRNRHDVQYETTRVLANVGFVIKRAEQKGAE